MFEDLLALKMQSSMFSGHVIPGAKKDLKIALSGVEGVGETAIAKRLAGESFKEEYNATLGVDFYSSFVTSYKGSKDSKRMQVLYTSGDPETQKNFRNAFINSDCFIFVYDLTKPDTIDANNEQFKRFMQTKAGVKILLGNKLDLIAADKSVKKVELSNIVREFVKENDILHFEISAKDGTNLDQLRSAIATKLCGFAEDAEVKFSKKLPDDSSSSSVVHQPGV